jgi:RNA polymerase sigma-70 factor (ECF subfamily)
MNERHVIDGLRMGEEWAYRYVFEAYYPTMCAIASHLLEDDFQAQSLAADVISHIYEKREELDIRSNLKSYLMTSTHNACLNLKKNKKTRTEHNFSKLEECDIQQIFAGKEENTPQRQLIQKELSQLMRSVIRDIPEPAKGTFLKNRLQGLSYREIAAQEGISANTVKFRIKRVLQIILSRLGKELE